jgi:hypothetical protein
MTSAREVRTKLSVKNFKISVLDLASCHRRDIQKFLHVGGADENVMKVLALKHLTRSLAELVRELSHEPQNFFELALLLAQSGSNQVRIISSLSSQNGRHT